MTKRTALLAAFVLVACVPAAFSEPSYSPSVGERIAYGAVITVVGLLLIALGLLTTKLLFRQRLNVRDARFYLYTLAFALGWFCLGWVTKVIQIVFLVAAFAIAGRTM